MIDYRGMLEANAEPKLAEFSAKLVPGDRKVSGVRVPVVRAIAKEIVRDDWTQIAGTEPESLEEAMLKGIVIATAPVSLEERIRLTDGFMKHVDNWAVCDTMFVSWKIPKGEEEKAWDYFAGLMETGEEFPMRVSAVARMSLFKDPDHCAMLLEDLASHDNPGYYYRMGSAWAVSMVYFRNREKTLDLLRSGRLETWTHNKSIQKICESRRASPEEKAAVREFRRTVP